MPIARAIRLWPWLMSITAAPAEPCAPQWNVAVTLAQDIPLEGQVHVLYKSFDGNADWKTVAASGSGRVFSATVPGTGVGVLLAVEVQTGAHGWRYPDVMRETPYRVLPPVAP